MPPRGRPAVAAARGGQDALSRRQSPPWGGGPDRRKRRPSRSRRSSTLLWSAAAAAAAVGAVVAAARRSVARPPGDGLRGEFEAAATRVVRVAEAARNALQPADPCTTNTLLQCECTVSSCAAVFPATMTCAPDFGGHARYCGGAGCTESPIDYHNSMAVVGPGLTAADGSTSVEVARDVCVTKSMDAAVFRSLAPAKQFTFAGTANGVMRYHPSRPGNGSAPIDECGGDYEVRLRPWYSEASSGPKDVVIAVDASAGMAAPAAAGGGASRWALAAAAVGTVLDTLNPRDYVAVVRSDGRAAAAAVTVGDTGPTLVAATDDQKQALKGAVAAAVPAGPLDVAAMMRAAFGLLRLSAEATAAGRGRSSAGCSRVVLWITGGTDACYGRPGCGADGAAGACTCTRDVLAEVRRLQRGLSAAAGGGLAEAILATLTVGDDVDDSLARQLACASTGVWARVPSDAAARPAVRTTALTGYYRLLSAERWGSGINVSRVVFSRLYEGSGALGVMTTASLPIFSRYSKRVLGVIGADIPIGRLAAASPGVTVADIEAEVARRAPVCRHRGNLSAAVDACQVQKLRGEDAACVPARPAPAAVRCFRAAADGADLYVAPADGASARPWAAANAYCAGLGGGGGGGSLAPVTSGRLNQLLAPLADADGSWVGVTRGRGAGAAGEWVTPAGGRVAYASWAAGPQRGACVAVDRRGLARNWAARRCADARPFVCVLPGAAAAPPAAACGDGGVVVDLSAPVAGRANPLFATGECAPDGGAARCDRGPPAAVRTKPFCPLRWEDTSATVCGNNCCGGCECLTSGTAAGRRRLGAGGIVGILVGVVVLGVGGCLGARAWRRRACRPGGGRGGGGADDASDDNDYYVMRPGDGAAADAGDGADTGKEAVKGAGEPPPAGGGNEPDTDAAAAYGGRGLAHAATPREGGLGPRVWTWSPGAFFAPAWRL